MMKTTATALLILSLSWHITDAQIPWDIEIIRAEAIATEPGFMHDFSPINLSLIHI